MDLESLRLFVAVARHGSFAAVARAREADPSSISRSVAGLENDLGVRLFQRTTRRMTLTEAGAEYLRSVEPLADDLAAAGERARAMAAGPVGTLRLTASVAFGQVCLMPLLADFRARFPDLKLKLLLTDSNLDLVAERIDLAVRLGPRLAGEGVGVKLRNTRYRAVASPDYIRRGGPIETPTDLRGHRCLLFDLPDFQRRWRFRDAAGAESEVAIDGDIVISSALALRDGALAGLGPALLADWLVDADVAAGRLTALLPGWRVTATSFDPAAWLLHPSRAYLPSKVRVTIDFLKERLGDRPYRT